METKLTAEDAKGALRDHVEEKALAARRRYGGTVDETVLRRMLEDRSVVRYPTRLQFDAGPLEPGEFAYAHPLGGKANDGFQLFVHPMLENEPEMLPLAVAYHLVRINYGEIVTHEEAELYGATLLGMDQEAYYQALCALADRIPAGA